MEAPSASSTARVHVWRSLTDASGLHQVSFPACHVCRFSALVSVRSKARRLSALAVQHLTVQLQTSPPTSWTVRLCKRSPVYANAKQINLSIRADISIFGPAASSLSVAVAQVSTRLRSRQRLSPCRTQGALFFAVAALGLAAARLQRYHGSTLHTEGVTAGRFFRHAAEAAPSRSLGSIRCAAHPLEARR